LQPGECFDDRPDSECGAFNNRVYHDTGNGSHTCVDCLYELHTDTDIETDDDGFDGGSGGGGDDEDDDGSGDGPGGPVNAPEINDTPQEAMKRNTEVKLRTIITDLVEGEGDTDFYTLFFYDNFDEIVNFYMQFTKYGPFEVIDQPSSKERKILETACAYMMMEIKQVRFQVLAQVTGYSESSLITEAVFFIQTYKGEDYEKGLYLIDLYASALSVPDNFILPMKTMWNEIKAVQGNMRTRIVAYMGAFLSKSEIPTTVSQLSKLTGISRGTLSPKFKAYKEILSEHLKV
tara:strand:- start:35 stop:904 length:870 start_codon:yes stop_codon:yes gene_type:complete